MKILQEFKTFAVKGNAIDIAVGVIIGAAFGGVVKSLVDDIITPPIGKLLGGIDFSNFFISLSGENFETLKAAKEAGAATINYGLFLNTLVSFLIVAWAVFLVIKMVNKLKREDSAPEPNTKVCTQCQSSINKKALRCPHCTSQV